MVRKRPHKHEVPTKALTAAKKGTKRFLRFLVHYSLAFQTSALRLGVCPLHFPNNNEDADTLAEALVAPKGEWCWEDLVAVNYEFDPVEAKLES